MSTEVFKTACGHCGGGIEYDSGYVHQQIACPHCDQQLILPANVPKNRPRKQHVPNSRLFAWCLLAVAVIVVGAVFMSSISNQERESVIGAFQALAVLGFAALIYFIPSIVAHAKGHHNTKAIFILNLFGGWTFFGWIGALVWASMEPPKK